MLLLSFVVCFSLHQQANLILFPTSNSCSVIAFPPEGLTLIKIEMGHELSFSGQTIRETQAGETWYQDIGVRRRQEVRDFALNTF